MKKSNISFARKSHWDFIFSQKATDKVGWYQKTPEISLAFLNESDIDIDKSIIDIGAGDGFFIDHLLGMGYTDISVLDISSAAINRVKKRLGVNADKVNWIIADSTKFITNKKFDFWHDRASFHFLTDEKEVDKYIENANNYIIKGGYLVIGTFSEKGPNSCSGIPIHQYSQGSLAIRFKPYFELISSMETNHKTPSGGVQDYVFCCFRKK